MLGIYLALPWIVGRFTQAVAGAYGFSEAYVRVERPGLHAWVVPEVRLSSASLTLVATNARLDYTLVELVQGHLTGIEVQLLQVKVAEPEQTGVTSGGADFAPEVLFPVLPVESIQIQRLQLEVPALGFVGEGAASWGAHELALELNGIAPAQASRFAFAATLTKAGVINALFRESEGDGADIVRASGRLQDNRLVLGGRFDLRGYALTLVSALAGLPAGAGVFDAAFDVVVPWPITPGLTWQEIRLQLDDATLRWAAETKELTLDLSAVSLDAQGGEFDGVLSGTATAVWEDARGKLELPAAYRLRYRDGVVTGGRGPRLDLAVVDARIHAWLQTFSLQPGADAHAGFEADIAASVDDWSLAGRLVGRVSPVRGELTYTGEAQVMGVEQNGEVTASYEIGEDTATVTGRVTAGQVRGAEFDLAYDQASGSGRFEIAHELAVRKPLVASMLSDWAEPYDVDSGKVDATLSASWRALDKVRCVVVLTLEQVAAHYEDYRAADIGGTLELRTEQLGVAPWQLTPASLVAGTVDVGFPVEDVRMQVAAEGPQLSVADTRAKLLGGSARAAPFDYDLHTGNARVELSLENLDLAAVLALEGEDVAGSGRLNGFLPVVVRDHQISMQSGTVRSSPPGGTIRLAPGLARGTGQPGLDFALVALRDFRYSELNADIDYAENGDMRLGVQLKGHNPAVERGRTIEYNLNITENLPTLLESLRLQDQVRARVERQLNR